MKSACDEGNHSDKVIEQIDPQGNSSGKITYRCEECGRVYSEIVEPGTHVWSEWITEKEADCENAGSQYRVCSIGEPHTEKQAVPALGHTYEITESEGTCTEPGRVVYTCAVCGDSYEEEGVISGHMMGEWIEIPPQAGVTGLRYRECMNSCDYREEYVVEALEKTSVFNTADAVIASVNSGLIIFFVLFLLADIKLILWDKKKRRALLEKRRQERLEVETFDFH